MSSLTLVTADALPQLPEADAGFTFAPAPLDLAVTQSPPPLPAFLLPPATQPLALAAGPAPQQPVAAGPAGAITIVGTHYVVDENSDTDDGTYSVGNLSLREAVKLSQATGQANTITFSSNLKGQTIKLASDIKIKDAGIYINGDTDGDKKADITLSGDSTTRIFTIYSSNGSAAFASLNFIDATGASGYKSGKGGAILAYKAAGLGINNCTFDNNKTTGGKGGAINGYASTISVANSTFSGNTAKYGAAFNLNGGSLSLFQTTLSGNKATSIVSAVTVDVTGVGSSLDIRSSTFSGNTGDYSVAVAGTGKIYNTVMVGNTLGGSDIGSSTFTIKNSVFGTTVAGLTSGVNGNLVSQTLTDTRLGTLADNGGPVKTFAITNRDSVLIDHGDNSFVPSGVTLDANLAHRIMGTKVDIGAVEFDPNRAPVITTTALAFDENSTASKTIAATDADGDSLTWSLSGGADRGLFTIDPSTGALTPNAAFNFETPSDADKDGTYTIEVAVTDGNATTKKTFGVTINDVSDTIIVTTEQDVVDANDGLISLREAVAMSNKGMAPETIRFDPTLAGRTITLLNDAIFISEDVDINGDIDGDKKPDITISGGNKTQLFCITVSLNDPTSAKKSSVFLSSLNLADGNGESSLGLEKGGAIKSIATGELSIKYCTFSGNSSGRLGGAIYVGGTKLSILDSTFSDNTSQYGAAVYGSTDKLSIVNSTFTENTGDTTKTWKSAGSIIYSRSFNSSNTALISNCTIVGNIGRTTMYIGRAGTTRIENSVIAGNTMLLDDMQLGNLTTSLAIKNTVFGSSPTGVTSGVDGNLTGVTASNLMLGALADNGGPVQTMNITRATSVLVNTGDNSLVPSGITTDANGHDRFEGGTTDIGAVEYVPSAATTGNKPPLILTKSLGSGESQRFIGHVLADDNPKDTLTFAIVSGLDGKFFRIDERTGEFYFRTRPDFDHPQDKDHDNTYRVKIAVSDGTSTSTKIIGIKVEDTRDPIVVTTASDITDPDDGALSLREAVALAEKTGGRDVITFADGLKGKTLVLTGGELNIRHALTIDGDSDGDGKSDVELSGNEASRIFHISGAKNNVRLEHLTLSGGHADGDGGAILLEGGGSLNILGSTLRDSHGSSGGAVFVDGTLTVAASLFMNNDAQDGGAVAGGTGALLQFVDTTFTANTATGHGGAVKLGDGGKLFLGHDTITLNSAGSGGGIDGGSGTVIIRNSAIAGNDAPSGADVAGGAAISSTHSVFGSDADGITGGENGNRESVAVLGLGQLLDNGGPTLTFAPHDSSLFVDLGGNPRVRDIADMDGDGNRRELLPFDGAGYWRIEGEASDIGAVEWHADQTITGTSANDTISGGSGDDVLDGGPGRDRLKGGMGHDAYVLHMDQGQDTIFGFKPGTDTIRLSAKEFGLHKGALPKALFGNEDGFSYDAKTGLLSFDDNGAAPGGTHILAVFTGHANLTAADIILV